MTLRRGEALQQRSRLTARKPLAKTTAKPSLAKLKKETTKVFNRYIKYRDSQLIDGRWVFPCITCDKPTLFRDEEGHFLRTAHAGHFQPETKNATRYNEQNVNGQCLTAESHLRMFDGTNKGIASIVVGDRLAAFNESSHEPEEAAVESVANFMPDNLYEVKLADGSQFWATGDHRVVSNGQWVRIDEMLHSVSTQDILEL